MSKKETTLRKEGATRKDSYFIDPRTIVINWKENPREDYGTDEEFEFLTNSISKEGVKEPVRVYSNNGELTLAHGFRRMKSTLEAIKRGVNIERIPVMQVPNNEESILVDHFTLNSAKPMNSVEKGDALLRLMNLTGENQSQIAERVGMNKVSTNKLIMFAQKASTPVKKSVISGELSFTNAISLIRDTEGTSNQNEVLGKAKKKTMKNGKTVVTIKAIKKASGTQRVLPYNKLINVANELKGTEFGDSLLELVKMINNDESTENIVSNLK